MALRYETIAGDEKRVRSHTGLSKQEFEELSVAFWVEWEHYIRHCTWCGKERRRQSKGRVNSVLSTVEDKLLFILFLLKTNPLQEVLATTFGLDQPQAGRWLELLRARLPATLGRERVLPERQSARLYRAVAGESKVIIDATERAVGRHQSKETKGKGQLPASPDYQALHRRIRELETERGILKSVYSASTVEYPIQPFRHNP